MNSRSKLVWGTVLVGATSIAVGSAIRAARADGIPTKDVLSYAGVLEDSKGPVNGTHNIEVAFYDAVSTGKRLCQTSPTPVNVVNGRFDVLLPDECVTSGIAKSPDTWISVVVDGSDTGRTKIGAVPYAVEASHAATIMPNLITISATVTGADGGSIDTPCPAGYTLVMASISEVQLTANGTNGWTNGTYACSNASGALRASVGNYANASFQSRFSCTGLCAR